MQRNHGQHRSVEGNGVVRFIVRGRGSGVAFAENQHTGTRQTVISTLDLNLYLRINKGKSRTFREPCPFSNMSLPRVVVVRYVGKPIEFSVVVEQGGGALWKSDRGALIST